jgi:hypothetical protein
MVPPADARNHRARRTTLGSRAGVAGKSEHAGHHRHRLTRNSGNVLYLLHLCVHHEAEMWVRGKPCSRLLHLHA